MQWSIWFGWTYFAYPDYLCVQSLVHFTLLHPDTINPKEPNIYPNTKFLEDVVVYDPLSVSVPDSRLL